MESEEKFLLSNVGFEEDREIGFGYVAERVVWRVVNITATGNTDGKAKGFIREIA
jgi:hypothetical protein